MNRLLALCVCAVCLIGCGGDQVTVEQVSLPRLRDVPHQSWPALAAARLFFGHKSVGQDIVAGVEECGAELPVRLRVLDDHQGRQLAGAGLRHAMIGENRDPDSKLRAFAAALDAGAGGWATIAWMKFCYADIDHATDVEALFSRYCAMLRQLEQQYPAVRFVHCTVPLTSYRQGLKARMRRVLQRLTGAAVEGCDENIRRHAYNQLMRERFGPAGTLFDLAQVESVSPTGARRRLSWRGQPFYQLVPAYGRDRGHLHASGRRHVAEQLLIFLADVAVRPTT